MLTDAQIVAIRDEHLAAQGEAFDCLAFARAIERHVISGRPWPTGDVGPLETSELEACAPWRRDDECTFLVLQLASGHEVPRSAISSWTDAECRAAEDWAYALHLQVSDHDDLQVPPMPPHVAAYRVNPGAAS